MAAPATLSVFNILRGTDGVAIAGVRVQCTLSINYATVAATGDAIDEIQQTTTTDGNGRYAFTIVGNDLLSPANTVYTIMEPHRSYQIAPQSTNGASQQTTAANVIVSTPTPLAAATSNITGNLTIAGTLGVTGLISANGGLTVTGTLSIPAGGFSMAGPLTLTAATSRIVPGATSMSLRNNANSADNLLVTDAGVVAVRAGLTVTAGGATITAGDLAVTAGNLTFAAAASRIVPGVTSLALRNTANSADNLLITDAGNATVRGSLTVTAGPLTVTAGGQTITAGNLTLTAGNLVFAAASAKIIPGATSLLIRNTADNASNVIITDAGLTTLRNGFLLPSAAAGALASNSAYATVPVKIDDQILAATATTITFTNPLPTNFRHLLIEWYARGDNAATNIKIGLRFNNISTATYDWQIVQGSAAAAAGVESIGATSIQAGTIPAATATANYFGGGSIKIFHYQGAVGNKVAIGESGFSLADTTTNQFYQGVMGKWRTTATAVTRIDLIASAGNFIIGSVFTLWGIP